VKWIARERPRVDRVAFPWLIEKFVDKDAEFICVRADQVMTEARTRSATPYDTADKTITPESVGVEALLEGIRIVHQPNDQKQREASRPILDALYAYCQTKVAATA